MIVRADLPCLAAWLHLRALLWPDDTAADHEAQARAMLAASDRTACLLALTDGGEAIGFAEAGLRHDYVNGCDTSPVLFLEGIYVARAHRRRGVARDLCAAAAAWGRERGVREFASDAPLANRASHALHQALGFTQTERVVFFRKLL